MDPKRARGRPPGKKKKRPAALPFIHGKGYLQPQLTGFVKALTLETNADGTRKYSRRDVAAMARCMGASAATATTTLLSREFANSFARSRTCCRFISSFLLCRIDGALLRATP